MTEKKRHKWKEHQSKNHSICVNGCNIIRYPAKKIPLANGWSWQSEYRNVTTGELSTIVPECVAGLKNG